jgi:four helix bundle protein
METIEKNRTPIRSYKDLNVWKVAMELVCEVYEVTRNFPDTERYGLTSQMRRCAISVPSNIAEGWSRNSARSFISYLNIAAGSMSELLTQLEIARRINYISDEKTIHLNLKGIEISKMLYMLTKKIESRSNTK